MKTVTIPAHFSELKAAATAACVPAVWSFIDDERMLVEPTLIAQSACKRLVARITYSEGNDTFAVVIYKKTRNPLKPWAPGQKLDGMSGADIVAYLHSKF